MHSWNEQVPDDQPRARRIKRRPQFALSVFLIILGMICLPFMWPIGLAVIIVAVVIDKAVCLCGNRIEPTSMLCPTCRAALDR